MQPDEIRDRATTLRWILTHGWGDPELRGKALSLVDEIIGFPPPSPPSRGEIVEFPGRRGKGGHGGPTKRTTRKLAFVVGHNKAAQGAWAAPPLSVSEFVLNSAIGEGLERNPPKGWEVAVFFRTPGGGYSGEIKRVYAEVDSWGPDAILEAHFNAGGEDYACVLHSKGAEKAARWAREASLVFSRSLGIRNVGAVARSRGERGALSLVSSRTPTILTEPFFGDNRNHARSVSSLGVAGLSEIYRKAILSFPA